MPIVATGAVDPFGTGFDPTRTSGRSPNNHPRSRGMGPPVERGRTPLTNVARLFAGQLLSHAIGIALRQCAGVEPCCRGRRQPTHRPYPEGHRGDINNAACALT